MNNSKKEVMMAASRQQFLLIIGTFILVISLISFTVISLSPSYEKAETTAPSKAEQKSVKVIEAKPKPVVTMDGAAKNKSGDLESKDSNEPEKASTAEN